MEPPVIRRSVWQKWPSVLFITLSGTFYLAVLVFYIVNRAYIQSVIRLVNPFLTTAILIILAGLLSYRRPENPISWLLIIVAVLNQTTQISAALSILLAKGVEPSATALSLGILGANINGLTFSTLAYIFILFPSGRLLSRRWVVANWLLGLIALSTVGNIAFSISQNTFINEANLTVLLSNPFSKTNIILALSLIFLALISLVSRSRNGSFIERQQIKYVLFAIALWAFGALLILLPPLRQYTDLFFAFIAPILPASIVLAILRYRLYDIDIIIRRTLSYSILTAVLGMVYFGGVVLLQYAAGGLFGGAESPLITVITTLAIAALFNPLRVRIQEFIDRRFFRAGYDAERALKDFSAIARDEVNLGRLSGSLIAVIENTIQPEKTSLWLRETTRGE